MNKDRKKNENEMKKKTRQTENERVSFFFFLGEALTINKKARHINIKNNVAIQGIQI
jgi:hypothetical protein